MAARITINRHVRETICTELVAACDRMDAAKAANRGEWGDHLAIRDAEAAVLAAACRILSHATRGKRYPLMTESTWGPPKF